MKRRLDLKDTVPQGFAKRSKTRLYTGSDFVRHSGNMKIEKLYEKLEEYEKIIDDLLESRNDIESRFTQLETYVYNSLYEDVVAIDQLVSTLNEEVYELKNLTTMNPADYLPPGVRPFPQYQAFSGRRRMLTQRRKHTKKK